jgi:hypothetical protein
MRKTKMVQITDEGRDKGKSFLLTEMPAAKAEKWAMRVLLLVAQSGADIPGGANSGMAGLAALGIQTILGGMHFEAFEPLLDQMMTCVQIIPDLKQPDYFRPLIDDDVNADIEEITTRIKLRVEVFNLHVNFSFGDLLSTSSILKTTESPSATQ